MAQLAAEFAKPFGGEEWAYLAGLWHDLGKYSKAFQEYLYAGDEASAETLVGRVDHSSAGAQRAVEDFRIAGHLIAYPLAGHHSGLLDGRSEHACLKVRLRKSVPDWRSGADGDFGKAAPALPEFVREAMGDTPRDPFAVAFFVRMLFSCLADADFLDTERFMAEQRAASRPYGRGLAELVAPFSSRLDGLQSGAPETAVNKARWDVRVACERAARETPGLFSLTVPTGGGKTLASLAFALRHAQEYGHERIIYVAPFTTIIEQNADVFRQFLGRDAVLEHHASLDPERATLASRLALENWDAPIIVTTAVQFYESLFANRTSRCRKLHRIANSIVILDEAQTLPVDCLAPCLRALRELTAHYGTSVVLCTATQPEIGIRDDFEIGLDDIREIIPEPRRLYRSLRRVAVENAGPLSDEQLVSDLCTSERALCIVNTTRHARHLFSRLGTDENHYHLSARMCPAHRRVVLRRIRQALAAGKRCRVISTQVVEAGVDVDFPVVYRALAGLDSIAQAAGRCNRNGTLKGRLGRTVVFQPDDTASRRFFAETAQVAAQVMELHGDDPMSLKAIENYFRLYYWEQRPRWDARHVLDEFRMTRDCELPFNFGFATAARQFRVIDDTGQKAVLVPFGRRGKAACDRLRHMPEPTRAALRAAQRYSVSVRLREWNEQIGSGIKMIYDDLGILESPELHYDADTGLNFDPEGPVFLEG